MKIIYVIGETKFRKTTNRNFKKWFWMFVIIFTLVHPVGSTASIQTESFGKISDSFSTNDQSKTLQLWEANESLFIPFTDDIILDPAVRYTGESTPLFNSLIEYNTQTKKFEPQLAIDWFVNYNSTEWTFVIRDDVKFHNGKFLDAIAVKLSIGRLIDINHPAFVHDTAFTAVYPSLVDNYIRADIISKYIITFKFKSPIAEFLSILTIVSIISPDSLIDNNFTLPIGTGPFFFDDTTSNETYYRFLPFNDHFKGISIFKEVIYSHTEDYAQDVLDNKFNFVPNGDFFVRNYNEEILSNPFWEIITDNIIAQQIIGQLNYNNPYLGNKNVRLALNLAIDQTEFIEQVGTHLGKEMETIYASDFLYKDESIKPFDFDIDLANSILDDAGFPRNEGGIRFELDIVGLPWRISQIDIVKDQLSKIGIDSSNSNLDLDNWFDMLFNGEYEVFIAGFGSAILDPINLESALRTDGIYNPVGHSNTIFDELFDLLSSTPVSQERRFYARLLQNEIKDEIPVLELMESQRTSLSDPNLVDHVQYTYQFRYQFQFLELQTNLNALQLSAEISNDEFPKSMFTISKTPIYYWHHDVVASSVSGQTISLTIKVNTKAETEMTEILEGKFVKSWSIQADNSDEKYHLKLYYDQIEFSSYSLEDFRVYEANAETGSFNQLEILSWNPELQFIEVEHQNNGLITLVDNIRPVIEIEDNKIGNLILFIAATVLGIIILFSRPHKYTKRRFVDHLKEDWFVYDLFTPSGTNILVVATFTFFVGGLLFWSLATLGILGIVGMTRSDRSPNEKNEGNLDLETKEESVESERPNVLVEGEKVDRHIFLKEQEIKLKGKTLDVYYYLIQNPGFHGLREIQRAMNYSSPNLATYHLNRLIKAKVISKSKSGSYGIIKDEVRLGGLDDHVKFLSYWIPRTIYIGAVLNGLGLLGIVLYGFGIISSPIVLVMSFITLMLSLILIRDSYMMVHKLKHPGSDSKLDSKALTISLHNKLTRAIELKNQNRARFKFQAQKIFEEIVREETVNHELTLFAMFNLCEILLDELKTYGEIEVLTEVESLTNKVFKIAEENNTTIWMVDALLLQHKFDLIRGNLDGASRKLENALSITKLENHELLQEKVNLEKINFENELIKWKNLIEDGSTIINRIEQSKLLEYIKHAEIMKTEFSGDYI